MVCDDQRAREKVDTPVVPAAIYSSQNNSSSFNDRVAEGLFLVIRKLVDLGDGDVSRSIVEGFGRVTMMMADVESSLSGCRSK